MFSSVAFILFISLTLSFFHLIPFSSFFLFLYFSIIRIFYTIFYLIRWEKRMNEREGEKALKNALSNSNFCILFNFTCCFYYHLLLLLFYYFLSLHNNPFFCFLIIESFKKVVVLIYSFSHSLDFCSLFLSLSLYLSHFKYIHSSLLFFINQLLKELI